MQGDATDFVLHAMLDGSPLNLSSSGPNGPYTAKVIVKASKNATDASGATYNLTPSAGILGICPWTLPASATATPGTFWYHFVVTDSSANPYTCNFGTLTINPA